MKKEDKVMRHRTSRKPGFIFGILLIIAGVLFLAFNSGLMEGGLKHVLFSWQMVLVVLGLCSMFHRHIFNGLALISIGVFFLFPRLANSYPDMFFWVESDFTRTYWPVLLIVGGILILIYVLVRPKQQLIGYVSETSSNPNRHKEYHRNKDAHRSGLDKNSVFANVEEIVLDPEFHGGEVNAVFGNIVLDLRKTNLPEGVTELEVNAVFGGITIYIPETWNVELHLSNVFGGFNDGRNRVLTENVDYTRKFVIVGSCVFGGGEIRN